tara:strand:+ start:87 stop:368 length:282 start_codon:yes stop_codon:yes gene_type:complete
LVIVNRDVKIKKRIALPKYIPITLLPLMLLWTGCRTVDHPVTRLTDGNVKRLMEQPEFSDVQQSTQTVKRWAREALHTVNDLEYQLRNVREQK